MTQVPGPITRIAAITLDTPVRISTAATVGTVNILSWELRQLAQSPLSPEARRVRRQCHELASRGGRPAPDAHRGGE
jgi:hypothetical protein